jgi:hypothetical protein
MMLFRSILPCLVVLALCGCESSQLNSPPAGGREKSSLGIGSTFAYQNAVTRNGFTQFDTISRTLISKIATIDGRNDLLGFTPGVFTDVEFYDVDEVGDLWFYDERYSNDSALKSGVWIRIPTSGSGVYETTSVDTTTILSGVARKVLAKYRYEADGSTSVLINGESLPAVKIKMTYDLKVWEDGVLSWPSYSHAGTQVYVPKMAILSSMTIASRSFDNNISNNYDYERQLISLEAK